MQNLIKLGLTLLFGVVVGLAVTYVSIAPKPSFGAIHAGPWVVWPRIGSTAVDPYARAAVARSGEVPLGLSEGLTFIARGDDSGAPLVGSCTYRLSGPVPAGRFWTLTPNTLAGYLIDNAAKRYAFTSREITRSVGGNFQVYLGGAAHPGNWLPIGEVGQYQLVLRIYDTTLSATASTLDKSLMPTIVREGCK